jgi:hypothetical protein
MFLSVDFENKGTVVFTNLMKKDIKNRKKFWISSTVFYNSAWGGGDDVVLTNGKKTYMN